MTKDTKYLLAGISAIIISAFIFVFAFVIITNNNVYHQMSQDALLEKRMTEACYNQNMVLVRSEAGPRCVPPSALVKPN